MDNRRSLVPKEGVVVVVAVVVAVVVVDVEEVSTKRAVDVLLFCFLEGRDMSLPQTVAVLTGFTERGSVV